MTSLARIHNLIKDRHLPSNFYSNRRHRSILGGMQVVPDTVVIHWSAGGGDEHDVADLMHRRATNETTRDDSSYSIVIGRTGDVVELVPPQHAPWSNGDGWLPTRQHLDGSDFVPVTAELCDDRTVGAKTAAHRWSNLRAFTICLCNSGGNYKNKSFVGPGVPGKHANPAVRSKLWEPFPDRQIESLWYVIAAARAALPSLRWVTGHDSMVNSDILGRSGAKTDPGAVFPWTSAPWGFFGLTTVLFDYDRVGWAVGR